MPAWMLPLALAAAGAMIDKKKPLRGALLGAGAGLLGPGMFPAAAGTGAAAGTATAAGTGTVAAEVVGLPQATGATGTFANTAGGAAAGYPGGYYVAPTVDPTVVPNPMDVWGQRASNVMTSAATANSLFPDEQPITPQPYQNTPLNLSGILSADEERKMFMTQDSQRRREDQRMMIDRILGRGQ